MNGKVFFDTNILIYCYTTTEPAKQTVATGLAQNPEAWVSTQVLQEISNTLRKRFGKSWSEIESVIKEVCQNFNVHQNREDTIFDALRIADRYQYSFYDSVILSSSLQIGCHTVYSEDMQHGQVIDGVLTIINPFLP